MGGEDWVVEGRKEERYEWGVRGLVDSLSVLNGLLGPTGSEQMINRGEVGRVLLMIHWVDFGCI